MCVSSLQMPLICIHATREIVGFILALTSKSNLKLLNKNDCMYGSMINQKRTHTWMPRCLLILFDAVFLGWTCRLWVEINLTHIMLTRLAIRLRILALVWQSTTQTQYNNVCRRRSFRFSVPLADGVLLFMYTCLTEGVALDDRLIVKIALWYQYISCQYVD